MENNNSTTSNNNDGKRKHQQELIYRCVIRLFNTIQKYNLQKGDKFKGDITHSLSKNQRKCIRDALNILKNLEIINEKDEYIGCIDENQRKEVELIRLQCNPIHSKRKIENIYLNNEDNIIFQYNTNKIISKIKSSFVGKDQEFKKSDVQRICRFVDADPFNKLWRELIDRNVIEKIERGNNKKKTRYRMKEKKQKH